MLYALDVHNNLGGNWITGIIPQTLGIDTRLWLISWIEADSPHPLTYTDDGGQNWNVYRERGTCRFKGTSRKTLHN